MPYVTVIFDPREVSQEVINYLKVWLQSRVANILSFDDVKVLNDDDTKTRPDEVIVMQMVAHPTDVNVPSLEIYIQAGRSKGRSGDKIAELLGEAIAGANLVPSKVLDDGQCGIFVTFHEHNGFRFIPSHG